MADRRTFLRGLVSLPLIGGSVAILGQSAAAATMPVVFDPAAFVSDLAAAGYGVSACRAVPRGGEAAPPPSYTIAPTRDAGRFGAAYIAVMTKWTAAMRACPDHVERVVAYRFEQDRVAFEGRHREIAL